jgi:hypothetical protein
MHLLWVCVVCSAWHEVLGVMQPHCAAVQLNLLLLLLLLLLLQVVLIPPLRVWFCRTTPCQDQRRPLITWVRETCFATLLPQVCAMLSKQAA